MTHQADVKNTMLLQQSGTFHMWFFCYLSLGCHILVSGLPRWLSGKESACSTGDAGDSGSNPGVGISPNPGRSSKISKILQDPCMVTHSSILAWRIHGQRSLVGYSPWGHKEADMTEWLSTPSFYIFKASYIMLFALIFHIQLYWIEGTRLSWGFMIHFS